MEYSFPQLLNKETKLLECISGSHSYGLNTKDSDLDVRGVFAHPLNRLIVGDFDKVIQDQKNDIIYTEIGFFLEQLAKNTPSALELFFIDNPEHILYRDERFNLLKAEDILSKKCYYTYGNYAMSQIKKAKGINKKSANPIDKKRKSLSDFAWVFKGQLSIPYKEWLETEKINPKSLSLCKMGNAENMYVLYDYPSTAGPILETNVNIVSVPKEAKVKVHICINLQAFQKYCKEYNEYWDWVANRNEKRYTTNVEKTSHKTFYDTKNMMHLFRLMSTCEEIFKEGIIRVYRAKDRDFLLKIRNGEFDYEDLIKMAEDKWALITELFEKSTLIEQPNQKQLKEFILNFY